MAELGQIVEKIRSKNAGPFWLTVDVFCGTPEVFEKLCNGLPTGAVAAVFGAPEAEVLRFEIGALNVLKFSLPRPHAQGSRRDRDMHGASWGALLSELEVEL